MFTENVSKNADLNDSGISLPSLPSSTNRNLHNIIVTFKLDREVITILICKRHLVSLLYCRGGSKELQV